MRGYYTGHLAGVRLRRVYEIAPARVRQYLEAEIRHVLARMPPGGLVLELGCGRCDGVMACRDGFRAGIMRAADFRRLCCEIEVEPCISEVDASSVFCEIQRGSEP